MRDYNELLTVLRACTSKDVGCMKCPRLSTKSFANDCAMSAVRDAADAIEELVAAVPKWHPVSEKPDRKDPYYARDNFIVRLQSGCIKELTYEFDNSDRCGDGYSPLFKEGWRETASPVTHWMYMPKFDPPKEVQENV